MLLAVARDESLSVAARVVLLARFVKVYGALWMDTSTGLTASLLRTKTSGFTSVSRVKLGFQMQLGCTRASPSGSHDAGRDAVHVSLH